MINKSNAIFALYPTVVTIRGDIAYDKDENIVEYDNSAIEEYVASKQYITKRQEEYPSYADQFDTIFHEGIDAWKAQIQAVKDKYPKV